VNTPGGYSGRVIDAAPFAIRVQDDVLDDLRERLARTRWPGPAPQPGWAYGVDAEYLRELADYWVGSYDWRTHERRLNAFPQYTADIDQQTVHFVHQRGRGRNPFPLILTHGWPSSFVELLKLAPLLTDPAAHGGDETDSFDVVIPSLPGYAFSSRPPRPGASTGRSTANLWTRLMTECLGYQRFGAQGQDLGASVTLWLAAEHADAVIGIHLPGVLTFPPKDQPVSEEGRAFLARQERWRNEEGAYALQQATYPRTLAYGLNDSPAGLAAWIIDKYRAWSDCDGDVERRFTKDELLTNITIYWVSGCIDSSFLFYYDRGHFPNPPPGSSGRIEVPVGVALFPKELPFTGPREWAEAGYNIARWTEMPRGGHFPAAEEPDLLASELREFFRPMRQSLAPAR
jgi:pimeloyl-ACP methyl ester carboxylesterase